METKYDTGVPRHEILTSILSLNKGTCFQVKETQYTTRCLGFRKLNLISPEDDDYRDHEPSSVVFTGFFYYYTIQSLIKSFMKTKFILYLMW